MTARSARLLLDAFDRRNSGFQYVDVFVAEDLSRVIVKFEAELETLRWHRIVEPILEGARWVPIDEPPGIQRRYTGRVYRHRQLKVPSVIADCIRQGDVDLALAVVKALANPGGESASESHD